MLEVLQFIFSGFLHFVGFLMLFSIFCGCLSQVSIVKIVYKYPKEEVKKKENVGELKRM